jgi:signal transduction histidine kinase
VTGIVGVAHDVTEEKRLQQEILEISHREQQRIGNDLHDGLGQELTGVALLLREVTRRLATQAPESAARIDDVIGVVNGAIENARLLAHGLSPLGLVGGSLAQALEALARSTRTRFGVDVKFRNAIAARDVWPADDATALHLYRIAQEAISNAIRHGRSSRIRLTLSSNGLVHRLSVCDDGCGLPAAGLRQEEGMGLKIMQYRASMIGGKLSVEDRRQGGVRVRCSFAPPLQGA